MSAPIVGGCCFRALRRQHDAQPERRQARVAIAKAVALRRLPIPGREHAERLGQILRDHLGAQLVEIELGHEACRERARAIEEKPAAVLRRRFDHDAVNDDLALRA